MLSTLLFADDIHELFWCFGSHHANLLQCHPHKDFEEVWQSVCLAYHSLK